ncbi:Lrp/AsnC family transcriptional regulator [Alteromonas sp. KUL106]|uniref:Lrp/AsnC family transcriptional regulator n=1 Tax=Alteromonas sp. KUL106 TaxID=2480799 RepID=UPI0012E4ADCA|nr:Lrp/AsnC family transcriptional regulator [Alteromonas sp. KUL106]GFD68662.1 AsnC family transcriptional regulator [Alteromonas sp. KUL106]GFD79422.1 AsnC family transcriptional regulator [Tenacibaculum sp. KUL118]
MDKLNLRIIRALSEDARISFSQLAKKVHLSAPAVAERVRKLEELGVITAYRPIINLEKLGLPIRALVECEVHKAQERKLKSMLLDMDEVIKIYNVTGVTTFIVEVGVTALSELDLFLEGIIDYCDTNTKLIMQIPIEEALPKGLEKMIEKNIERCEGQ